MNPRAAPATLGSSVARLPSAQDAGDPGPKEKRGGPAPLPAWGGGRRANKSGNSNWERQADTEQR